LQRAFPDGGAGRAARRRAAGPHAILASHAANHAASRFAADIAAMKLEATTGIAPVYTVLQTVA